MRRLVDPSSVPLRTLPGTARDLFINADGAQMLAFDNVSAIPAPISDALCQLATGSGFGTRKLYTDSDQVMVGGSRSIVLTGLLNVVERSDLADRAVVMQLPVIEPEKRRTEKEFWRALEQEQPQILGALLDIVAHGLSQLSHVQLSHMPRMADFALWAVACETAYTKPGTFLAAYEAHAAEATDVVVENDPVATAIVAFMHERDNWKGTVTELLRELSVHDHAEARPSEWKTWPRDPALFGKALQRVKGALRKTGIEVITGSRALDRTRTRHLELRRIEPPSTQASYTDSADSVDSADSKKSATIIPIHRT
jgi:hypothetical protein